MTVTRDYFKFTRKGRFAELLPIGKPEVSQRDLFKVTLFGQDRVAYMDDCRRKASNKGKPFWTPEERSIFYLPFRSTVKRGVRVSMMRVDKLINSLKVTYPTFIDSLNNKDIRLSINRCVSHMSKKRVTSFGPFPKDPDSGPLAVKYFIYNRETKMRHPVIDVPSHFSPGVIIV